MMQDNAFENWKRIWNLKKVSGENEELSLEKLIQLNGFDSVCGDYTVDQWKKMVLGIISRANISQKSNVLEVGCGSGALLYQLKKLTDCNIYGVDYSKSLIDVAANNIDGKFIQSEANQFLQPSIEMDVVLSHSVFQYFPNIAYMNEVVVRMSNSLKSGGALFLMDLNDLDMQDQYHELRRKQYDVPSDYDEKYRGFEHLFIDKNKLVDFLYQLNFKNISFFEHDADNYLNAQYRFNVIARKN